MLAIIQARLDSKRFPRKTLKKIYGIPMIKRVYDRVKKADQIDKVIISIPKNKNNYDLKKFCQKNLIICHEGSHLNVVSRLYKAAKKFKAKAFVRISGDSPLIDPNIIDESVRVYKKKKIDLVTNTHLRSCPSGQSVEVIKMDALKKVTKKDLTNYEKEHVTTYFYNNLNKFKIYHIKFKSLKFKNLKFSIDTKKDLKILLRKFSKKQFNKLYLIIK